MILLKSLIVLLLLIIVAHFVKMGWGNKRDSDREGFRNIDVDEVNTYYDKNIADDLDSGNTGAKPPALQNTLALMGGEMSTPVGSTQLAPSQKVQGLAKKQQEEEESQSIGKHKELADSALDMNYLKGQMDELVRLGNEAQVINENFKNISN